MLHLILKTYKTSIVVNTSQHQQSPENLVPWGQLLFAVASLQITVEAVPEDEEERENSEWWKAKKWVYYALPLPRHPLSVGSHKVSHFLATDCDSSKNRTSSIHCSFRRRKAEIGWIRPRRPCLKSLWQEVLWKGSNSQRCRLRGGAEVVVGHGIVPWGVCSIGMFTFRFLVVVVQT